MAQKKMKLDIIKPNCAGIDIGSKSHFIAVGPRTGRCKRIWCLRQ
jgi:hypothetical protein